VRAACESFTGDLAGTFYNYADMREYTKEDHRSRGWLFKDDDPRLRNSGLQRDWPHGRGYFHNDAKTFFLWVNNEDQLSIISMDNKALIADTFERLCKASEVIDEMLNFSKDDHLGFITSSPENIGTALGASVRVNVPHLYKTNQEKMNEISDKYQVKCLPIEGKNAKSYSGTVDLYNKLIIGRSEADLV
jgi:arginine kinase